MQRLDQEKVNLFPAVEGGELFIEVRLETGRLVDMLKVTAEEGKKLLSELQMSLTALEDGKRHDASWQREMQASHGQRV